MMRIFVAYPFNAVGQSIVDKDVVPMLRRFGHLVVRGPFDERGGIVANIRHAIEDCDGLVGVIAGANPNVFFEIGLASALGKPCILLAASTCDLAMLDGAYPAIVGLDGRAGRRQFSGMLADWSLASNDDGATRPINRLDAAV